jgi:hypothetical protein
MCARGFEQVPRVGTAASDRSAAWISVVPLDCKANMVPSEAVRSERYLNGTRETAQRVHGEIHAGVGGALSDGNRIRRESQGKVRSWGWRLDG